VTEAEAISLETIVVELMSREKVSGSLVSAEISATSRLRRGHGGPDFLSYFHPSSYLRGSLIAGFPCDVQKSVLQNVGECLIWKRKDRGQNARSSKPDVRNISQ
jgi:hypothetical protein